MPLHFLLFDKGIRDSYNRLRNRTREAIWILRHTELLAVSFLRISLETYASPGDEALIAKVGTAMLVLALLFLAAAVVLLILFIVKISKRKKMNKRLQEINRRLQSVPGTFGTY